MSSPLAENRYVLTKELFAEGMGRVLEDSYGKTARRAVLALLCLWLLLAAVTLLLRQSPAYLLAEALVLGLAALWISVYVPRAKTRVAWKKLEARYGTDLERSAFFYEDRLVVYAGDREIRVEYGSIRRVLRSERLLILLAEDKTGILLKRDAFVSGSETTVEALLHP